MDRRKGFTLMELTIIIALVAVISTVVVSFSIMMNKRAVANQEKLNAIIEMDTIETIAENWINARILEEANIEAVQDGAVLKADEHSLQLEDEIFIVKESETVASRLSLASIVGINFEIVEINDDAIFFCTVQFVQNEKLESRVFTICPRVGQVIGGVGA